MSASTSYVHEYRQLLPEEHQSTPVVYVPSWAQMQETLRRKELAEQNQEFVRDLVAKRGWGDRIRYRAMLEVEVAMHRLGLTPAERSAIL
jgi:hypothetical protein